MTRTNVPDRSPLSPRTNPNFPTAEWRCHECNKLLGVRRGAKLQLRFQGHNYLANLPVEAICRGCGARNHT